MNSISWNEAHDQNLIWGERFPTREHDVVKFFKFCSHPEESKLKTEIQQKFKFVDKHKPMSGAA